MIASEAGPGPVVALPPHDPVSPNLLLRASRVLGSQEAAERWLEHPAIGLDRRRPIDLLATPSGAKMVEDYLTRIEYGVYT